MQVSLSVLTSSSLSPDLKAIKQSLRFPLIRFEDAKVELGKLHCALSLSDTFGLLFCCVYNDIFRYIMIYFKNEILTVQSLMFSYVS